MLHYNTYNLPGSYKESGKHFQLGLELRERVEENRTPQHYKIYNIESHLIGDTMVQSDNVNDN